MEIGKDFFTEVEIAEFNMLYLCIIQPWKWVSGYCDPKNLELSTFSMGVYLKTYGKRPSPIHIARRL